MYDPFKGFYIAEEMHGLWERSNASYLNLAMDRRRSIRRLISSLGKMMIWTGDRFTAWGKHLQYPTKRQSNQPT